MDFPKYPFAVRLIGFEASEHSHLSAMLARAPSRGPAFFCLHEDSLQDPHVFICNGNDVHALAELASYNPSQVQPALIVGEAEADFPFHRLERPVDRKQLFILLTEMIEMRAEERARNTARGLPDVPERRRKKRLDFDLTDPGVYEGMRKPPRKGAVIVIDRNPAMRDAVEQLLIKHGTQVEWTDNAATAVGWCREIHVALVLINTSVPDVDPYGVCRSIKSQDGGQQIAVVLLVGGSFHYNSSKAKAAGIRGILDKPVPTRQLGATLKKLLSLPT